MSFQPRAGISEGLVARRPRPSASARPALRGAGGDSAERASLLGNRYSDASAQHRQERRKGPAERRRLGSFELRARVDHRLVSRPISFPAYNLFILKNVPAAASCRAWASARITDFATENDGCERHACGVSRHEHPIAPERP